MALLTFSAAPAKGATVTVDLDPSWLLNYNEIFNDTYWSVLTNTRVVVVTFTTEYGGQDFRLRFDLSDPSPSAEMTISLKARSGTVFLSRLVLSDFDNGELILPKQLITDAVDYDFTLT